MKFGRDFKDITQYLHLTKYGIFSKSLRLDVTVVYYKKTVSVK